MNRITRLLFVLVLAALQVRAATEPVGGTVNVVWVTPQEINPGVRLYPGEKLKVTVAGSVDINHLSWTDRSCTLWVFCSETRREEAQPRTPDVVPATFTLRNEQNAAPFDKDRPGVRIAGEFVAAPTYELTLGTSTAQEFTTPYYLRGYIADGKFTRRVVSGFNGLVPEWTDRAETISRTECPQASPCSVGSYNVTITVDSSGRLPLFAAYLNAAKRKTAEIRSAHVLDTFFRNDPANAREIARLLLAHADRNYPVRSLSNERVSMLDLAASFDSTLPELANAVVENHIARGIVNREAAESALATSQATLDTQKANGTAKLDHYIEVGKSHANLAKTDERPSNIADAVHLESAALHYRNAADVTIAGLNAHPHDAHVQQARERAAEWLMSRAEALRKIHTRAALTRASESISEARALLPKTLTGRLIAISGDGMYAVFADTLSNIAAVGSGKDVAYAAAGHALRDGWRVVAAPAPLRLIVTRDKEVGVLDLSTGSAVAPLSAPLAAAVVSTSAGATGTIVGLADGSVVRFDDKGVIEISAARAKPVRVAHAGEAAAYAYGVGGEPIQLQGTKSGTFTASNATPWELRSLAVSHDAEWIVAQVREGSGNGARTKWLAWSVAAPATAKVLATTAKVDDEPWRTAFVDGAVVISDAPGEAAAFALQTGAEIWRYRHPGPPSTLRLFPAGVGNVALVAERGALSGLVLANGQRIEKPIQLAVPIAGETVFVTAAAKRATAATVIGARDVAALAVVELPSGRTRTTLPVAELVPGLTGILSGGRFAYSYSSPRNAVVLFDLERGQNADAISDALRADGRSVLRILDSPHAGHWFTLRTAADGTAVTLASYVDLKQVATHAFTAPAPLQGTGAGVPPISDVGWRLLEHGAHPFTSSHMVHEFMPRRKEWPSATAADEYRIPVVRADATRAALSTTELAAAEPSSLVRTVGDRVVRVKNGAVLVDDHVVFSGDAAAADRMGVRFSTDGSTVLVAGIASGTHVLRVIDVRTKNVRNCKSCDAFAPSPTSSSFIVAVGGEIVAFPVASGIRVIDLATDRVIGEFPDAQPLVVSREFLLAASDPATTTLWRLPSRYEGSPSREKVAP